MPNIKSSIRSMKTDAERRARNVSVKSAVRTSMRHVEEAVSRGDLSGAEQQLRQAMSTIDRAVAKNVIHKNAAARRKARLAQKVNTLKTQESEKDKAAE